MPQPRKSPDLAKVLDKKTVEKTVGERIRECRQRRNLSMRALASLSGVRLSKLSVVEAGKRPELLGHEAVSLARVLGITVDYLLGTHEYSDVFFNIDENNSNIQCYDVISFFDGNPKKGTSRFMSNHYSITYFFMNIDNLKFFQSEPNRYIPQFHGYCAYEMSIGVFVPADLEVFTIYEDRSLILFRNQKARRDFFQRDIADRLRSARRCWEQRLNAVLLTAAEAGDVYSVEVLLANGADPNTRHRENHKTPLILAAGEGHVATVQALLAREADITARDDEDKTAIAKAEARGHNEIVQMINRVVS